MVTKKDRNYMRRLGRALDLQQKERRGEAAMEPPGWKIEKALILSGELLSRSSPGRERKEFFSLPALWASRKASRKRHAPPAD